VKRFGRNDEFIIGLLILCGCIVMAGSLHIRYLADSSGGQLFSRSGEVYLFLSRSHTGHEFTYLEFPILVIGENLVPLSKFDTKDIRRAEEVIRITPASITRKVFELGMGRDSRELKYLTPFTDGFYADCGGTICKWMPSGFVPATPEEQVTHTEQQLVTTDIDKKVVNGWSVRDFASLAAGEQIELRVGDAAMVVVENRAAPAGRYPWIEAELRETNQALEVLYEVNGAPRRVSRKEYERTLRGAQP